MPAGGSGHTGSGTFTQPTDLSGCFIWLRSTSVGTYNGGPVTYWHDDSGSGNHVYWLNYPAGSSSAIFPVYNTNVINNFPVVSWTGVNSTLATTGNNGSLQFSPQDVTTFSVYRTTTLAWQNIWSIDNGSGNPNSSGNAFIVSLNGPVTFPNVSGFSFNYGSGTTITNNIYSIYASSTPNNIVMSPINTFMLRHDRFRQDNTFIFGRYGADVASGQATTSYNIANRFNVGDSSSLGKIFTGDIAEIIAYSPRLSDYNVEVVNQYLLQKYALPNVGSFILYMWATSNSGQYNGKSLYISGTGINKSTTLYVGNSQTGTKNTTLFTHGYSSAQTSSTLFIGSSTGINHSTTLYVSNIQSLSGNSPLYIHGKLLYQNSTTLFVGNITNINKSTTLYVGSSVLRTSGISLYTSGTHLGTASTTLYIQAQLQTVPWITLYEHGKLATSGGFSMYVSSNSGDYRSTTLYTYAKASGNTTLPLYTFSQANPATTGITTLYVNATASNVNGLYGTANLYLEGGHFSNSMPLYVCTQPVNTKPSAGMPLYISGPVHTGYTYGSVELFTANYWQSLQSSRVRLYNKGTGGLVGGSIYDSTLPLYIDVPFGGVAPMLVHGGGHSSGIVTLYSSGVNKNSQGFDLFIGGTALSNNCTLYTSGPTRVSGEVSMYIKGDPVSNSSISLYIGGF